MTRHIAIIGAGMAGAAAARALHGAGLRVTLFDKSRGVGGRMATRRVSTLAAGDLRFDHGAQYFTARGDAFRGALAPLRADGAVVEWVRARAEGWRDAALVAAPHMSDAVRALTQGCDLALNATVTALTRTPDGWMASCEEGRHADHVYDAVLVTTPAPQALPLLDSAGVAFEGVDRVVYAPCWALMLALDAPLVGVADTLRPESSPLAWIARDSSKPGRPVGKECWVAHAGPQWSRANLEMTKEDAAQALLSEAQRLLGFAAAPAVAVAHRWRYALVETPAGADFFWDAGTRVGAAGDWCIGPRVEAAFDSGDALARHVLATLAA